MMDGSDFLSLFSVHPNEAQVVGIFYVHYTTFHTHSWTENKIRGRIKSTLNVPYIPCWRIPWVGTHILNTLLSTRVDSSTWVHFNTSMGTLKHTQGGTKGLTASWAQQSIQALRKYCRLTVLLRLNLVPPALPILASMVKAKEGVGMEKGRRERRRRRGRGGRRKDRGAYIRVRLIPSSQCLLQLLQTTMKAGVSMASTSPLLPSPYCHHTLLPYTYHHQHST